MGMSETSIPARMPRTQEGLKSVLNMNVKYVEERTPIVWGVSCYLLPVPSSSEQNCAV